MVENWINTKAPHSLFDPCHGFLADAQLNRKTYHNFLVPVCFHRKRIRAQHSQLDFLSMAMCLPHGAEILLNGFFHLVYKRIR